MPTDSRLWCAACRKPLELDKKAGRRDECPHCTAELHSCINCRNYDPRLTRPCLEPQARAEETIRDATRANFCQWFEHRPGPPPGEEKASGADAKAAFDSLFGGGNKSANPEKEAAAQAFDKLFKR